MVNTLSPAERIISSTVRIECARRGRGVSTGTGFFCRLLQKDGYYAPVLVTCRHVVAGAQRGRLHLHLATSRGQPLTAKYHTLTLDDFQSRWLPHPETRVDLCVMPMAELLLEVQQRTTLAFELLDAALIPTAAELAELSAGDDVVVVSYPNGVWDSVNNRPVVRKGITATEPRVEYMGRAEFLIDMAWLPGASGSPVFLWNIGSYVTKAGESRGGSRVKLLGILSGSPAHRLTSAVELMNESLDQQATASPAILDTFGVVVKARKLLEFEPILEAMAVRGQHRWAW